ncbi:MAG: methyltransferase domain-containing protein [Spirochaetaceae bacterium]|jgi:trans-aconitate 2-methyltransferase|nr:methyltransferase domain-containing protein [Spirochaetaceae bacterium]
MNDWNPNKYLEFKNERTQPAIDLAARINLNNPKNIIDVGCGPGNSTQILAKRWPNSSITGLDSSKTMISKAKEDYPNQIWIHDNAENITDDKKYTLVFSNAAIQWMDNHELLIPKLWNVVENSGVLAVQIPAFNNMPINTATTNIINKNKWKKYTKNKNTSLLNYHELYYYYEILNNYTNEIVLWKTHYFHILPTLNGIIDFVRTTALKPYLENLPNEEKRQELENEILEECKEYYKIQTDGKVLFPFDRIFFIAYKNIDKSKRYCS